MVKKKRPQRHEEERDEEGTAERQAEAQPAFCLCFGQLHKLFANCQSCGKVLCEKEEAEECVFCHQPLSRGHDTELVTDAFFEKAVAAKQRLLDFQEGKQASKNIIDDQTDWYELKNNLWESKEVRRQAEEEEARQESRKERDERLLQIEIDFEKGTATGKDVSRALHSEKEEVRQFLDGVGRKEQGKKDRELGHSKTHEESLQAVVRSVKEALQGKAGEDPHPRKTRQQPVVQNDDAFAVLSEFGRAMEDPGQNAQVKVRADI